MAQDFQGIIFNELLVLLTGCNESDNQCDSNCSNVTCLKLSTCSDVVSTLSDVQLGASLMSDWNLVKCKWFSLQCNKSAAFIRISQLIIFV